MVGFDTPQSKVVEKLLDAYCSLDANNLEPLLSKNYQYLPFPENTDLPKHTKESHLQTWGLFPRRPNLKCVFNTGGPY